MAERGPDLAREMRHRGLAVGAGDGGDRVRLAAVEARRKQGQTAVRVQIDDDRHAAARLGVERQRVGIVGQDRDRAARHRLAGKGAPVAGRAAQRGEQKAGLDAARIGGDPGDLGIAGRDPRDQTPNSRRLRSAQ